MMTLVEIKNNGGATLNKNGENCALRSGYQMSVRDLMIIPVYALRKKALAELLTQLNRGEYLGVWIDNGKAYIDISKRIPTKRQAIEDGIANNQLSVYCWKNNSVLWLT